MQQKAIMEQTNQTLAKALEVLDAFSAEHTERGIRELGRELGINPTTIFRFVHTLCNSATWNKIAIAKVILLDRKLSNWHIFMLFETHYHQ